MQPESRFASSYSESIGIEDDIPSAQVRSQVHVVPENRSEPVAKTRESKLDIVSAAVVVGMTGQFVMFIIGLVTEFVQRLLENILISAFVGLCVGVIAYALMKGND